jgi:hypothetical protein
MNESRTARPSAAADVAAAIAGRWPLAGPFAGARTLAAVAGTDDPLGAAVTLAAQMSDAASTLGAAPDMLAAALEHAIDSPPARAGGARRLTREYSYLLSSYTAETCEPLPVFNTLRGAGVAGDDIRNAQPGIEYVLLVRDRGTAEWRTAMHGNRTIAEAVAFYWPAS